MEHKLKRDIVIITGGNGLLGQQYCNAVEAINGVPIVLDIKEPPALNVIDRVCNHEWIKCDITDEQQVIDALEDIKGLYGKDWPIYGLINNAAIDPKFDAVGVGDTPKSRLETYDLEQWSKELAVGLTGAFLCTKHFGAEMARNGRGSIINISSVLGHVAPNQALYKKEPKLLNGLKAYDYNQPLQATWEITPDDKQPVKPVTYSVIKHAIIGLTRYTATYWAQQGVRCNAISPGGVYTTHSDDFVARLSKYIPLGRMARKDEYNAAVQFLLTDASSFMTGAIMNIDGGQTSW